MRSSDSFDEITTGCDLPVLRNILQANRALLNGKMFGYEGSDVFDIIKVT